MVECRGEQELLGQEALHTLILNSSSLLCDCKLRWRPQYALLNTLQGVTAECAHPMGLNGEQMVDIHPELFTCWISPSRTSWWNPRPRSP